MTISLNASGVTSANNALLQLWPAASSGDGFFIQNRSYNDMELLVGPPDSAPLIFLLPAYGGGGRGNFADSTLIPADLEINIRSGYASQPFTAYRTQS